ncbi:MAG: N-acetylmuramoyl-L-alanine amidase [Acidaminobacteraceae bacterium]
MKKVIIITCILMLFVLVGITVGDVSTSNWESIELTDNFDKSVREYPIVGLMLSGDDIISDVPAILYTLEGKTRTLVPVSVISKELGYEVTWNQERQEATIFAGSKEIVLKIDSSIAYVDGKKYNLPSSVPAKLMTYQGISRTLVPVAFITEHLGMDIKWMNDTKTVEIFKPRQSVTDIKYVTDSRFKEIRFKTSGEVQSTSYYIEGIGVGTRDKMVVDLQNTVLNVDKDRIDSDGKIDLRVYFYGVNSAQAFQVKGEDKVRLEINLDTRQGFDTWYDKKTSEVVVQFINSVVDIRHEEIYNTDAIIIDTNQDDPAVNVKQLKDKIIVDVINSKMRYKDGNYGELVLNEGGVSSVYFSQFEPTSEYDPDDMISRVVINLSKSASQDNVFIEVIDDKIYVYVSGAPLNGFNYNKLGLDNATLDINLDKYMEYTRYYDQSSRTLTLGIAKESVSLEKMNTDIDDSIIDVISIDTTSSLDYYLVKLNLSKGSTFEDITEPGESSQINLRFFNNDLANSAYKEKLIVIDAGHGGSDSGAVGANSLEKDLALDMSRQLRKKFESLGFKVYMTRETDKRVSLQERTIVANKLQATVFVSIHMNSFTRTDVEGLEVLYSPNGNLNNIGLAANAHKYLISSLKPRDRGLVERPNLYVLRTSDMPSILVELGFVSNLNEEQKLMDEKYREKAADAIAKGVKEYIDKGKFTK